MIYDSIKLNFGDSILLFYWINLEVRQFELQIILPLDMLFLMHESFELSKLQLHLLSPLPIQDYYFVEILRMLPY